jgi:VanZ family protein
LLFVLILTYATLDELLQIPVGRSAEWGDWLADGVGAALGIAVGTFVSRTR